MSAVLLRIFCLVMAKRFILFSLQFCRRHFLNDSKVTFSCLFKPQAISWSYSYSNILLEHVQSGKRATTARDFILSCFILKNVAIPGTCFVYFHLFKHKIQVLKQINVKICIRCRDLNPQHLEHEFPPITTIPGLP